MKISKELLENKDFMERARSLYAEHVRINEHLEEEWKHDLGETLEKDMQKRPNTYIDHWETILAIRMFG